MLTVHPYPLLRKLCRGGLLCALVFLQGCQIGNGERNGSADFVDIRDIVPSIHIEPRYYSSDNFVGEVISGYEAARIYMTRPAARALAEVQGQLEAFGLGLKIFDAYRPQRAVDHFVRWAQDLDDQAMKPRYYPNVNKADLFRDGYIASRSGHSRGSTVDLTLIDLETGTELDMGSPWDFFDPISWPQSNAVSAQQRANRLLLRRIMLEHGFVPLREEWWHFTLGNEPYPDRYFDFVVD